MSELSSNILTEIREVVGTTVRLELQLNDFKNSVNTRFDNLTEMVMDVRSRTIHLEAQVAEVQETLLDFGEAESKDALATIDHERRMTRLERLSNIKSTTLEHLRDID